MKNSIHIPDSFSGIFYSLLIDVLSWQLDMEIKKAKQKKFN